MLGEGWRERKKSNLSYTEEYNLSLGLCWNVLGEGWGERKKSNLSYTEEYNLSLGLCWNVLGEGSGGGGGREKKAICHILKSITLA